MIVLQTPRLIIRNWRESDRAVFHELNCDPGKMRYFPTNPSHKESSDFFDTQCEMTAITGLGFYALEEKLSSKIIGMCGLLKAHTGCFIKKGSIKITWSLLPNFWGKGYITEAAKEVLTYGFKEFQPEEIFGCSGEHNEYSIKIMEEIGMTYLGRQDLSPNKVSAANPELKSRLIYSIKKNSYK